MAVLRTRRVAPPGIGPVMFPPGAVSSAVPLCFGRQFLSGPAGIGGRFGVACVDGPVAWEEGFTEHGSIDPGVARTLPGHWMDNVLFLSPVPVLRRPKRRVTVPS